jgi:uncharacterized protein YjbI with pentapeptide repeats
LSFAFLDRTDLSDADCESANMEAVSLVDAIACGTRFIGANFSQARLWQADLRRADFAGAHFRFSVIGNTDLSMAINLQDVIHDGPSAISIDTIYRSKGNIPEYFLRGAGIPDNFIAYMHSLTGEVLQFYSCFISYSSKDQEFADRLYADLQAKGVRCWFAPHDVKGGKKIHEQIDQAIRIYDKLLLILSQASMESPWVNTEIYNARQRELRENKQMLFPVSLVPFTAIQEWKSFDTDSGKDLPREIREYYIPDFSNWKDNDSYQKAFDRLLQDFRAETPVAS